MKVVIQSILKGTNAYSVNKFIDKMYEFTKLSTTPEVSIFLRLAIREAGEILNTLNPLVDEVKIKDPSDVKIGDVIVVSDVCEVDMVVVDYPFESDGCWVCKVRNEFYPESWTVAWNKEKSIWERLF